MTDPRSARTIPLLLALAACTEGGAPPGGGGGGALRGPCALERTAGLFEVELGDAHTSVSGRVVARPPPVSPPKQEGEQGKCRLLRRMNPFCDPACGSEQLCASDGRCVAAPKGLALGTVAVAGLKKMVLMEPRAPSNEYFDVMLPHPGYDVGAAIALDTGGGELPPFRLRGVGVAPMELLTRDWTIDPTKDLVVTWSRGAAGARIRVHLDVDQHGASPVSLACEVEDDGSLTFEAGLLARLLAYGVSGFPSVSVSRRTDDSVDVSPGCVGLGVFSRATVALKVVGHTPCNAMNPCPAGKMCDVRRETCL